jgi:hypothetical protein
LLNETAFFYAFVTSHQEISSSKFHKVGCHLDILAAQRLSSAAGEASPTERRNSAQPIHSVSIKPVNPIRIHMT